VSCSKTCTDIDCRARLAASIRPPIPPPTMATSQLRVISTAHLDIDPITGRYCPRPIGTPVGCPRTSYHPLPGQATRQAAVQLPASRTLTEKPVVAPDTSALNPMLRQATTPGCDPAASAMRASGTERGLKRSPVQPRPSPARSEGTRLRPYRRAANLRSQRGTYRNRRGGPTATPVVRASAQIIGFWVSQTLADRRPPGTAPVGVAGTVGGVWTVTRRHRHPGMVRLAR
jgi:hypothetical protein